MAIRSGRFKAGDVHTHSLQIVQGRSGVFRIYNSGNNPFTVKPDNDVSIPLPVNGSVDIKVSDAIFITTEAESEVEGIYEYIEPFNPIRNGRFQGDASGGITIVEGDTDLLYRILNSGTLPFDVKVDDAVVTSLPPTFSVDVPSKSQIVVATAEDEDESVEGIYDSLHERKEIRSGRFKIREVRNASGIPQPIDMYPHRIIDLRGESGSAWYRLFNSGDHTIVVEAGKDDPEERLGKVAPLQSFDFQVLKQNSRRAVFVQGASVDGTIDNKLPIEGIYDFLGLVRN